MTNRICAHVIRRALLVLVVIGSVSANESYPRSLTEQFDYYLDNQCFNLGLARDTNNQILPGQVGPNLAAYCTSVPPSVTGGATYAQWMDLPSDLLNDTDGMIGLVNVRRERFSHEALRGQKPTSLLDKITTFGLLASTDGRYTRHGDELETEGFTKLKLGADYHLASTVFVGMALMIEPGPLYTHTAHLDYGATIFGSWQPVERSFVDAAASLNRYESLFSHIVGRNLVITQTGNVMRFSNDPSQASAVQTLKEYRIEIAGGYDFALGRAIVGPRVSIDMRRIHADSYQEEGGTYSANTLPAPMTLAFDNRRLRSTRTMLSVNATTTVSPGRLKVSPSVEVGWSHELGYKEIVLTPRFSEDLRANPARFRLSTPPVDRNTIDVRAGATLLLRSNITLFLQFDGILGHANREQFGAMTGAVVQL